jgi:hypothetical protein
LIVVGENGIRPEPLSERVAERTTIGKQPNIDAIAAGCCLDSLMVFTLAGAS